MCLCHQVWECLCVCVCTRETSNIPIEKKRKREARMNGKKRINWQMYCTFQCVHSIHAQWERLIDGQHNNIQSATVTTIFTTMMFDIDDNKLTQIHTFQLKVVWKDEPNTNTERERHRHRHTHTKHTRQETDEGNESTRYSFISNGSQEHWLLLLLLFRTVVVYNATSYYIG